MLSSTRLQECGRDQQEPHPVLQALTHQQGAALWSQYTQEGRLDWPWSRRNGFKQQVHNYILNMCPCKRDLKAKSRMEWLKSFCFWLLVFFPGRTDRWSKSMRSKHFYSPSNERIEVLFDMLSIKVSGDQDWTSLIGGFFLVSVISPILFVLFHDFTPSNYSYFFIIALGKLLPIGMHKQDHIIK